MAVSRINEAGLNINQYGNRNLIINGAMQVAQRATSVSVTDGTNEGYQSLDRYSFIYGNNAGGVATISQDTTVPSGQGFSSSYKVDVTTADTSVASTHQVYFRQIIEAQNIRNSGWNYTDSTGNSKLTVSFWARSSKAGIYCLCLRDVDASGNMDYVKEYTLVADTWKHVTCSVPSNSSLVFNNDNNSGLQVIWNLVAGTDRNNATDGAWNTADTSLATSNQVNFFDSTSNDFYLTGVQLEVGDTATDFEHRTFADELARCQRYYFKISGTNALIGHGFYYGSTEVDVLVTFPVPFRATPTVTSSNNTDDFIFQHYSDTFNTFGGIQYYNGDSLNMYAQAYVSGTGGQAGYVRVNNASTGQVEFSSEL